MSTTEAFNVLLQQDKNVVSERLGITKNALKQLVFRYRNGNLGQEKMGEMLRKFGFKLIVAKQWVL